VTMRPMSSMLLLLLSLMLGVAQAGMSGTATLETEATGRSTTVTALGKLRMAMLEWYCIQSAEHAAERPCMNHAFMTKMRQAATPEAKRALVQERSHAMPATEEGRKSLALQSRQGYARMYKAYCAQPQPKIPEVCSNDSLKKMYQAFETAAP